MNKQIIMSGMRTTGNLHIGHYWGVIKNWLELQEQYSCFFAVADWHGLTTHYQDPSQISTHSLNMVIDWLACGVDPHKSTIFIQSHVLEHAELHLLLSMITPISWLQRIPSYKDQQQKLSSKRLDTYGFLGYPLLQTADILLYGADKVPVGADQESHIEVAREIARRFNWLYGTDNERKQAVMDLLSKINNDTAQEYQLLANKFHDNQDTSLLKEIDTLLRAQDSLSRKERDKLIDNAKIEYEHILAEPVALLSEVPKMPGTDGQKMSKSYGNTISLREDADLISQKILKMPTDPARIKRDDTGNPEKCPVWDLHKIYSNDEVQCWVKNGCTSASIGCVDCKKQLINNINEHHQPIQAKIRHLEQDIGYVEKIIADGNGRAKTAAAATMSKVRESMGLANIAATR